MLDMNNPPIACGVLLWGAVALSLMFHLTCCCRAWQLPQVRKDTLWSGGFALLWTAMWAGVWALITFTGPHGPALTFGPAAVASGMLCLTVFPCLLYGSLAQEPAKGWLWCTTPI